MCRLVGVWKKSKAAAGGLLEQVSQLEFIWLKGRVELNRCGRGDGGGQTAIG